MRDPLDAGEAVGELLHLVAQAAHGNGFHATALLKVDMRGGDDLVGVVGLHAGNLGYELGDAQVVHERDGAHDWRRRVFELLIDQGIAYEVADCLGTVHQKAALGGVAVELVEEQCWHGDAEAYEVARHVLILR